MTTHTKTVGVALVLLLLVAAIWLAGGAAWWSPDPTPAAASDAVRGPDLHDAGLPPSQAVERVAEADPPAEEAADVGDAALPYAFDVSITVLNADDVPARRASVLVAPLGLPLNRARTDSRGVLRLRFRARQPSIDLVVGVGADGRIVERLTALADRPLARTFRSDAREGRRARGTFALFVNATGPTRTPELAFDEQGWCQFAIAGRAPAGAGPNLVLQGAEIELGTFLAHGVLSIDASVSAGSPSLRIPDEPPTESFVEGTVYTAAGPPAAGALVCVGQDDEWRWSDRTDEQGRYRIEVIPGVWRLRAGGGDLGVAESELSVAAGSTLQWAPRLDRGAEVLGRLVDEEGQGLAGYRLDLRSADGLWLDRTKTGEDGSFAVPNCPPGQLVVEVTHAEGGLPQHEFYAMPGGSSEHVIPAACVARTSISVAPTPFERVGAAGIELWLWQGDRAQVLPVAEAETLGGSIAPGTYAAELRGAFGVEPQAIGVRSLGVQAVAPGQSVDLGPVPLPELATLALEGEGWADVEWTYEHAAVDVRGSLDPGGPRVVLPGTWRMTRAGATRVLEIEAGELVLGEDDLPR